MDGSADQPSNGACFSGTRAQTERRVYSHFMPSLFPSLFHGVKGAIYFFEIFGSLIKFPIDLLIFNSH